MCRTVRRTLHVCLKLGNRYKVRTIMFYNLDIRINFVKNQLFKIKLNIAYNIRLGQLLKGYYKLGQLLFKGYYY